MYRVFRSGIAIECDSAADVAALLATCGAPSEAPAAPVSPSRVARPRVRRSAKQRPVRRRVTKPVRHAAVTPRSAGDSDAAGRRQILLALITKAEVGLTGSELLQRTPTMNPRDRQNALTGLKAQGAIVRKGNTWVKAMAA